MTSLGPARLEVRDVSQVRRSGKDPAGLPRGKASARLGPANGWDDPDLVPGRPRRAMVRVGGARHDPTGCGRAFNLPTPAAEGKVLYLILTWRSCGLPSGQEPLTRPRLETWGSGGRRRQRRRLHLGSGSIIGQPNTGPTAGRRRATGKASGGVTGVRGSESDRSTDAVGGRPCARRPTSTALAAFALVSGRDSLGTYQHVAFQDIGFLRSRPGQP